MQVKGATGFLFRTLVGLLRVPMAPPVAAEADADGCCLLTAADGSPSCRLGRFRDGGAIAGEATGRFRSADGGSMEDARVAPDQEVGLELAEGSFLALGRSP